MGRWVGVQRFYNLMLITGIEKTFKVSNFFLVCKNICPVFFLFSRPNPNKKYGKSLFYLDYSYGNENWSQREYSAGFRQKKIWQKPAYEKRKKSKRPIFTPPKPLPLLLDAYDWILTPIPIHNPIAIPIPILMSITISRPILISIPNPIPISISTFRTQ